MSDSSNLSQARELRLPESHSPRGREGWIGWARWCDKDEWWSRELALKRVRKHTAIWSVSVTGHAAKAQTCSWRVLGLPVCSETELQQLGPTAASAAATEPLHSELRSLLMAATSCQSARATCHTERGGEQENEESHSLYTCCST